MNNNRLGQHYDRYSNMNIQEMNKDKYKSNLISKNNDIQLSVVREPDVNYTLHDYYLCISSASRDLTKYPSESNYVVFLDNPYKNVKQIELIQTIIPHKNSVDTEPYLLLNIKEINDTVYSNNQQLLNSFAIIQLSPPTVSDGFINTDKRIHENIPKVFRTPISLSRLSIRITNSEGVDFDFGGNNSVVKAFQNTLVFKITCLEHSRDSLNQRNVY